jgi:hypothetical protein
MHCRPCNQKGVNKLEKGKNRGMPDFFSFLFSFFFFSLESQLSNTPLDLFSWWWVTGQKWRFLSMKNQREKLSFVQRTESDCVRTNTTSFYWKRCVWMTGLPLGFPEGLSFFFYSIMGKGLQGIEQPQRGGHPNNKAQMKTAKHKHKQTVGNGFINDLKETNNKSGLSRGRTRRFKMAKGHREEPQVMATATVKVEVEGKEQPNSKQDLMPETHTGCKVSTIITNQLKARRQ